MEITRNSLFYNIDSKEQDRMMHCFRTTLQRYESGEVVCFFDDIDKGIGIIESGEACVVYCLPNGSRTILEYLTEGDIFGQLFYFHAMRQNISVEATSKCSIRFMDYEHIIKRCPEACDHHTQLVNNVLCMVSEKTKSICEHLEILSQRSIRDKLNSYFEIASSQSGSNEFKIPFTMSTLSDYLSVDRSAMSREIKKMREEGIIEVKNRKVKLL